MRLDAGEGGEEGQPPSDGADARGGEGSGRGLGTSGFRVGGRWLLGPILQVQGPAGEAGRPGSRASNRCPPGEGRPHDQSGLSGRPLDRDPQERLAADVAVRGAVAGEPRLLHLGAELQGRRVTVEQGMAEELLVAFELVLPGVFLGGIGEQQVAARAKQRNSLANKAGWSLVGTWNRL